MTAQLDCLAEAPLETSGVTLDTLPVEYFGSVDHHDGFAPSLPEEASFRHRSWRAPRRRIFESLLRTSQPCRRVQHFGECGSQLWLMRDGRELSLGCNQCHDRLCQPCQKRRQSDLIESIMLRMHDEKASCRFVTLTLRHCDAPLTVQLDRLVSSFKLLRKHPDVGQAMLGGAWFMEIKLDKQKARWHPHLHVIVAGTFIKHLKLSQAWLAVTGDSYIVDIRPVDDPGRRAQYVTKYATKPLANEVTLVPAKLDEFVLAIKGRRLHQCFGTWAKAVARDEVPRSTPTRIGHLSMLHRDAMAGDIQSIVWLVMAHARWPTLRKSFPLPATVQPAREQPP